VAELMGEGFANSAVVPEQLNGVECCATQGMGIWLNTEDKPPTQFGELPRSSVLDPVADFELFAHFFSCDARTLAPSTFILYTIQLTDSQYRQKFSRKFFEERGGFFFGICTRKGVWF
jgi:hypothetical protein